MNKLKQSVDDLLQDLCLKSGKNNNDHYVKEEQHLEDLNDSAYDQIGHLDDDDVSVWVCAYSATAVKTLAALPR